MATSYGREGFTLRADQIQSIRDKAIEALKNAIIAKGKRPEDYDYVNILPKDDLGLTNDEFKHTFTAAYTDEEYVNRTLGDDEFITIYGYTNINSSPVTLKLSFYNGVSLKKIVHVQASYAQQEPYVFFEPEVWAEGEVMKIEIYGNAASDDYPILLGIVAKPKGSRLSSQ